MLLTEEYFEKCKIHKAEMEKVIVIFHVGKFYEAYSGPDENDTEGCARDMSLVLNMALTKKNKKKPSHKLSNPYQCGFPTYNLMKHITRMNDMGYTVALYDQTDNTDDRSRILKGIYTENIRKEFEEQEDGTNCMVYAFGVEKYPVQEGKLRYHEYRQYYCYIEMTSGKIFFFEGQDTDLARMVDKFFTQNNPEEIIVFYENISTEEIDLIQEKISSKTKKLVLSPWDFYNQKRNQGLSNVLLENVKNYHEHNLEMFPQLDHLLEKLLEYIYKHDAFLIKELLIDDGAWNVEGMTTFLQFNRDLFRELFIFGISEERKETSSQCPKTIFDMLSKGMNTMGCRYLGRLLKYPSANPTDILEIQEKLKTPIDLAKLKLLKILPDLEWYYLRWKRGNLNYRLLSHLLKYYRELEVFYPTLIDFNQAVHNLWNIKKMEEFPHLLLLFDDFFERNDIEIQNEIDPIRTKIMTIFTKFEQAETVDLKLICREDVEDYYFETTTKKWAKMSTATKKQFQELERTSGNVRVIPHNLIQLRTEMAMEYKKLVVCQKKHYQRQTKQLLDAFHHVLVNVNTTIVQDSTFGNLQQFFKKYNYTCPMLQNTNTSFIKVKNLRHALIEYMNPDSLYTPCDCDIDTTCNVGKLIYGENASGKSTYMKAIGTSLWLAQCGLWVPAEKFEFYPYTRIYSKFNHFDNIFKGHSLFVAEMNELQYILKNSSSSTLLLLDELMSGTEIHSASSLIVSVIEDFLEKKISFCFTTHIHWIGKYLEEKYSNLLKTFHFVYDTKKDIRNEKLITTKIEDFYNRKIYQGSGPSLYGIEVAHQVGIPSSIVERAKKYRDGITLRFDNPRKTRVSKYNSKMTLDQCFVCQSRKQLHTHHIFPQKEFHEKKTIHFQKDALYNLIVLCEECHIKVHH